MIYIAFLAPLVSILDCILSLCRAFSLSRSSLNIKNHLKSQIVKRKSSNIENNLTYSDAAQPLRIQRLHDITKVKMQTNDSKANAVVRIKTAWSTPLKFAVYNDWGLDQIKLYKFRRHAWIDVLFFLRCYIVSSCIVWIHNPFDSIVVQHLLFSLFLVLSMKASHKLDLNLKICVS